MDLSVLVAVLVCVFTIFTLKWCFFRRNIPPGPWGLPIIGFLPFLSRMPHLDFSRLAKKYGSVFSIRLGSKNVIVLNDFKSSKEALSKDAFMGKPEEFPIELNKEVFETGAFFKLPWKELRKFSLHTFRDLGVGKSKLEEYIREEIMKLLEEFRRNVGKSFCVRGLLAPSASNNIASLVFGKRYNFDDPVLRMMNNSVTEVVDAANQLGWLLFFPWLGKIARFLSKLRVNKSSKAINELRNYTWKEIEEHEKTLNPNNIRDFIDRFLLEMQKRKEEPVFSKRVLHDLVFFFFVGGTETVRVTVEWLVLTVAAHPDAQRRVQNEIDEKIGRSRLPERSDHKDMPYTEAFIMEMMRWRSVAPVTAFRETLSDTEVNGFFIPKNTLIISNLWAIHNDTEYWGKDSDVFRPERFVREDGKTLKCDQYMPFSIGKRSCPGEPLANVEVFLYFVSILQRFNIKLPEGKNADFEGVFGGSFAPKPQDIVLTERI